jgi:hypothetical protein
MSAADDIVIVVTPDFPTLKATHSFFEYLNEHGTKLPEPTIVVNEIYALQTLTPGDIENALGRRVAIRIPYDPLLYLRAANQGTPVFAAAPAGPGRDLRPELGAPWRPGPFMGLWRDRERLLVVVRQRLVVRHHDLLDQLAGAGHEARLRQVRSDPRVQRIGVVPLLEQDRLLTAIGLQPTGELDVHEAGLLTEQRHLASEDGVEGTNPCCADARPQDANDH